MLKTPDFFKINSGCIIHFKIAHDGGLHFQIGNKPLSSTQIKQIVSSVLYASKSAVILERLHALGVTLAIDDFGIGYSSLSYLKLFPLNILKIDKSFIDDIPDQQSDREITSTIIAIAHTLYLKVLAEGVENVARLIFLQEQGCDFYQGYLTSPPLPATKFEQLLRKSIASD